MGTTSKSIRKIFVFNGMIIGGIGTTLGVVLGAVLCFLLKQYKFIELDPDVYYISTLPVKLEMPDVLIIGCAAMVICFLSTLYPAIRLLRLNPVKAMQFLYINGYAVQGKRTSLYMTNDGYHYARGRHGCHRVRRVSACPRGHRAW